MHPSLEKQLIPILEVMCEWRTPGKGEEPEVNRDASSFQQGHEGRFVGRMQEGVQPKGSGGHSLLAY